MFNECVNGCSRSRVEWQYTSDCLNRGESIMEGKLKENWEEFEHKYKNSSSWAIWNSADSSDKKKMGSISGKNIFENDSFKEQINTDYVFVGLNASMPSDDYKWASFHKQGSNDYKLRYALMGTAYWGSYLTDVIKELKCDDLIVKPSNSTEVVKYLDENPKIEQDNIDRLKDELSYFSVRPTLVVMGDAANDIVSRYFAGEYNIVSIPHYSAYISKENYRSKVLELLGRSQAVDFLLCCYFGRSKQLIDAAIDRAYVDMAARTMKGFSKSKKEINKKWSCRYKASKRIKNSLINYHDNDFKKWHEELISGLLKDYGKKRLTYGQAQKWLNMTIKYIYILRMILGEDAQELFVIRSFLTSTTTCDYYPPVDSYVLKGAKIISKKTWSSMCETDYNSVKKKMGSEKGFLWELENWEQFSEEHAYSDRDSYAYYLKHPTPKTY